VAVTPAIGTIAIGQTQQLTATLRDASGNVLTGRSVTWASMRRSWGSVSASGLVSGIAAGLVPVTPRARASAARASITVTLAAPPPAATWPNEPSGMTLVSDEPFDALVHGGWNAVQAAGHQWIGLVTALDAGAPLSPAGVLAVHVRERLRGGQRAGRGVLRSVEPRKETYFAFWWKPSNRFRTKARAT